MAKITISSLTEALRSLDNELVENHINTYSAALDTYFYPKEVVEPLDKKIADGGSEKLIDGLTTEGDLGTDDPNSLSILPAAFSMGHAVVANSVKTATIDLSAKMEAFATSIKTNLAALKATAGSKKKSDSKDDDKGPGIKKLAMSTISDGLGIGFANILTFLKIALPLDQMAKVIKGNEAQLETMSNVFNSIANLAEAVNKAGPMLNIETAKQIRKFIKYTVKTVDKTSNWLTPERTEKYINNFEDFRTKILDSEQGAFVKLCNGFMDVGKFFTKNKEDLNNARKAIRHALGTTMLIGVLAVLSIVVGGIGSIAFPLMSFAIRGVEAVLKGLVRIGKINAMEVLKSALPILAAIPSIAILTLMLLGINKAMSSVDNPIETTLAFGLFTLTIFGVMGVMALIGAFAIYAVPMILLGSLGFLAMIPGIAALGKVIKKIDGLEITDEHVEKAKNIAIITGSLLLAGLSFIGLAAIAMLLLISVPLAIIGLKSLGLGINALKGTIDKLSKVDLSAAANAATAAVSIAIMLPAMVIIGVAFIALSAIGLIMWIVVPMAVKGLNSIAEGAIAVGKVASKFAEIDLASVIMAALVAPFVAILAVEMAAMGVAFMVMGGVGLLLKFIMPSVITGMIAIATGAFAIQIAAKALTLLDVGTLFMAAIIAPLVSVVAVEMAVMGLAFLAIAGVGFILTFMMPFAIKGLIAIAGGTLALIATINIIAAAMETVDLGALFMLPLLGLAVSIGIMPIVFVFMTLGGLGLFVKGLIKRATSLLVTLAVGMLAMVVIFKAAQELQPYLEQGPELIQNVKTAIKYVNKMILPFAALGLRVIFIPWIVASALVIASLAIACMALVPTMVAIKKVSEVLVDEETIDSLSKSIHSLQRMTLELAVLGIFGRLMPIIALGVITYSVSFILMRSSLVSVMAGTKLLAENAPDEEQLNKIILFLNKINDITKAMNKLSIAQVLSARFKAEMLKPLAINLGVLGNSLKTIQDIDTEKVTSVVSSMGDIVGATANMEVAGIYKQAIAYNVLAKSLGNIAKQAPKLASVAQALSMIARENMKANTDKEVAGNMKSSSDTEMLSKTASLENSTLKKDNINKSTGESQGPEYFSKFDEVVQGLSSVTSAIQNLASSFNVTVQDGGGEDDKKKK